MPDEDFMFGPAGIAAQARCALEVCVYCGAQNNDVGDDNGLVALALARPYIIARCNNCDTWAVVPVTHTEAVDAG